ncbi:hypothetical protein WA1_05800 [Scytonema hofmannii PCC 7110]|uniref:Uncharacterized protein n=1 Tax=Scytonema hofmannii PCC 7110 TaxID=128403 RepID=A0A139WTR9_9CYAN|nr:NERD domain-containing protein [Scytonema hofmannii]KYC35810.1 hypothetical protein WA1_05800 [Scytonema hofmannii PCC 7110]
MFPENLRSDVNSKAEKLLYQAFQKQLSDNFTVFHQVRWQARNIRNGAKDGEIDFVITSPDLGILVLEVKGGEIYYNGREGNWYSNQMRIKDPFQQACTSKHNLINRLKELSYWKSLWIPIGHAVAFPDVEVNGSLPLDAPRNIILDRTDSNNLSGWVQEALNYWRGENPPTNRSRNSFDVKSIKDLIKVIAPNPRKLPSHHDDSAFIELTEQQIGMLDFIASYRRVAISGCAGSGKTLLALEKARRLQEQGFSVLLTCYNKSLAQFMDKTLGWKPNLHVYNFHALCEKLSRQAALTPNREQFSQEQLFREIYPERLIQAADKIRWHVDAVIVDEGQDFHENWWYALKLLLNEPDDGIFYFFYDSNQNIYDAGWRPPLEEAPFPLNKNCRNTQKVHEYVLKFHPNPNSMSSLCPLGQDVEIYRYTGDTQLKNLLGRFLHHLVIDKGFATKDIVILTTRRKGSLQNQMVGQFRIKADPDTNRNEIFCNTIHYFKGLESQVVILVETEPNNSDHQKLMYVGASRARHHLIVLQANV